MNKKVIKNYLYNVLYQVLLIVSPIITLPYKTSVLTPDNIGIYSYVFSVLSYILMIGSIGMGLYGKREIAYIKEDKYLRSKVLYELILLKTITLTLVACIFYIFIGFKSIYKIYYLIISVDIFFNIYDLTWFYQGIEEFKKISIINFINRILNILSIFVFVKSDNDLIKYFIITVVFDIIPLIILLIMSKNYIQKISLKDINIFRHLKVCITLFIPQICIQIYAVCDKIMLGNLQHNMSEVGFYEYSHKIILIITHIISAFAVVMLPVISQEFIKNNWDGIKKYINESINFVIFLAIPLTFGAIALSNNLVNVIFGKNYLKAIVLIKILALSIIPIGITTIIGEQYLVSTKQEKKFTKYIMIGTITNIVINFVLIPKYASIGASLATIISEIMILLIEIPIIKELINKKEFILNFMKYVLYSIIMFTVVYLIGMIQRNYIILIIQVLIGILSYIVILLLTKDKMFYTIINKLKK